MLTSTLVPACPPIGVTVSRRGAGRHTCWATTGAAPRRTVTQRASGSVEERVMMVRLAGRGNATSRGLAGAPGSISQRPGLKPSQNRSVCATSANGRATPSKATPFDVEVHKPRPGLPRGGWGQPLSRRSMMGAPTYGIRTWKLQQSKSAGREQGSSHLLHVECVHRRADRRLVPEALDCRRGSRRNPQPVAPEQTAASVSIVPITSADASTPHRSRLRKLSRGGRHGMRHS